MNLPNRITIENFVLDVASGELFLDPDYPVALIFKAYDILGSDPDQAYEIAKGVLAREENYWPAIQSHSIYTGNDRFSRWQIQQRNRVSSIDPGLW